MHPRTIKIQEFLDKIIEKVFLWAIPKWVQPNWLSYFRIATVPFIAWLLFADQIAWAFALFIISASSDFLDGAMARRRDQITPLGKVVDPLADKMLIATMLAFLGFEYLIVKIFLVFITGEIIAVLVGAVLSYKVGRPVGANVWGKIKMILQSLAVFLFLLGLTTKQPSLIIVSEYVLFAALFFALAAGLEIARTRSDEFLASAKKMFSIK